MVQSALNPFSGGGQRPRQPSVDPRMAGIQGDPEFVAGRYDPYALYPEAAAKQRLLGNEDKAARLQAMTDALGLPQNPDVATIAEHGYKPPERSYFERLIGALSTPYKLVNTAVQDVLSGPEENATAGDYARILGQGLEDFGNLLPGIAGLVPDTTVFDKEEFKKRTGFEPLSGSKTLTLAGIPEQTTWYGKVARGILDFTYQVVVDPISWVMPGTGGMSRRVLGEKGMSFLDNLVEEAAVGKTKTSWGREIASQLKTMRGEAVDSLRVEGKTMAEIVAEVDEPAAVLARRKLVRDKFADTLLPPLLLKDFTKLAAVLPKDVFRELPLFAQGGTRLVYPFGGKKILESGIYIPGTRGLGKKIFRDPFQAIISRAEKSPSFVGLADFMKGIRTGLDRWNIIVDGVRDGKITGSQYMYMREAARASEIRSALSEASVNLNRAQLKIAKSWENMTADVLTGTGKPLSFDDFHSLLANAVQSDDPLARDIGFQIRNAYGSGPKAEQLIADAQEFLAGRERWVGGSIKNVVKLVEEIERRAYPYGGALYDAKVSTTVARWQKLMDRAPQALSDEGKVVLRILGQSGVKVDEEVMRWAAAGGRDSAGAEILARLFQHYTEVSAGGAELHKSSPMLIRQYGRAPIIPLVEDGNIVMLEKDWLQRTATSARGGDIVQLAEGAKPGFLANAEMNAMIIGHVRSLVDKYDIKFPRKIDLENLRVFEENMFVGTQKFMEETATLMQQLDLASTLQTVGLMRPSTTIVEYQAMMERMIAGVKKAAPEIRRMEKRVKNVRRFWLRTEGKGVAEKQSLPAERRAVDAFGRIVKQRSRVAEVDFTPEVRDALGEGRVVHHALMDTHDPRIVAAADSTVGREELNTVFEGSKSVAERVADGNIVEIVDPNKFPDTRDMFDFGKSSRNRLVMRARLGKLSEPQRRMLEAHVIEMARIQGKDIVDVVSAASDKIVMSIPVKQAMFNVGARQGFEKNIEQYGNAVQFVVDALRQSKGDQASQARTLRWLADLFGKGNLDDGKKIVTEIMAYGGKDVLYNDALTEFYTLMNTLLEGRVRTAATSEGEQLGGVISEEWARMSILGGQDPSEVNLLGGLLTKDDLAALKRMNEIGYSELKQLGFSKDQFLPSQKEVAHIRGEDGFANVAAFGLAGNALKGQVLEPNTARFMQQIVWNMQGIYQPLPIAKLAKTSQQVTDWWKGMATVTRPTFHIRNLLGGVWNNQIIGVRLRDYAAVQSNMIKVRRAMSRQHLPLEEAVAKVADREMQKTILAAWDSGLLNSSFARAEYRNVSRVARNKYGDMVQLFNPLSADKFAPVQGGALAMESIEDFLRLSAFTAWYDPAVKGSENVAREMALMVHFDYQDLTKFETWVKKFVPFFVWQRRNLPLQLKVMVERPALMARYSHLMDATREQFKPDIPQDDYAGSEYWTAQAVGTDIVLNKGTPFWARMMLDPDLPINDLLDMDPLSPSDTFQHFMSMLGPLFSGTLQVMKQSEYGDVNAPAPLDKVFRQMAVHGLFDNEESGQIPYSVRTIFNTVFPFYKELVESPLGPSDPKQAAALGAPGGNMAGRVALDMLKGVGVRAQTPGMSRGPAFQASTELNDILGQLRVGPLEQKTEERYRRMTSGR